MSALRVALLDHTGGPYVEELAAALSAAGHDSRVVRSRAIAPLEAGFRRRGFTPALSHVPVVTAALARARCQVAHAFSAPDAMAALAWRRLRGRPAVFTCIEAIARDTVSDRRLRLSALRRAVEESDALIAADAEVRAGLGRWFALTPPVLAAGDATAHERLYRELIAAPAQLSRLP